MTLWVGPCPRQAGGQSGHLQVEPAEGTKASLLLHFLRAGLQAPAASPLQGAFAPAAHIPKGLHTGAVRDAQQAGSWGLWRTQGLSRREGAPGLAPLVKPALWSPGSLGQQLDKVLGPQHSGSRLQESLTLWLQNQTWARRPWGWRPVPEGMLGAGGGQGSGSCGESRQVGWWGARLSLPTEAQTSHSLPSAAVGDLTQAARGGVPSVAPRSWAWDSHHRVPTLQGTRLRYEILGPPLGPQDWGGGGGGLRGPLTQRCSDPVSSTPSGAWLCALPEMKVGLHAHNLGVESARAQGGPTLPPHVAEAAEPSEPTSRRWEGRVPPASL